jgi:hypothetical protein
MSERLVYIDHSVVRDGKLDELETAMAELVDFVETNEPQILSYNVYFSADGTRMTVMHTHTDVASLAFHLDLGRPEFRKIGEFIEFEAIDVYGYPGADLVEALREKASMLGGGSVSVHDHYEGFDRLSVG